MVQDINLSYNYVESLDGLEKLYSLQKINLSYNLVNDFAEIGILVGLPFLEALILAGNPIADRVDYRQVINT